MCVDPLRPFPPEPAVQANPPPRIGQPVAHLQAQELDPCVAQARSRSTAVASQRHNRNAPLPPAKALRQENRLLLGAPNTIQARNQHCCVVHCNLPAVLSIRSSYAAIARANAKSFRDQARSKSLAVSVPPFGRRMRAITSVWLVPGCRREIATNGTTKATKGAAIAAPNSK